MLRPLPRKASALRTAAAGYWVPTLLVLVPATALCAALAGLSLRWEQVHDTPLFVYIAHLIVEEGQAPYRDVFDMNLPATYAAYGAVVAVLGTSDLAVRIADLACLALIALATVLLLRRLGAVAAWSGAALFSLSYLAMGPAVALQRDFLLLVPISAAALVASRALASWRLKLGAIGALLGLAALIKPHALVGAPALLWYAARTQPHPADSPSRPTPVRAIGWSALGLLAPFALAALYLWTQDALGELTSIMSRYWPLHAHLNNSGSTLYGAARLSFLVESVQRLNNQAIWLVPGALAVYQALWIRRADRQLYDATLFLAMMTAAYAVYPAASGQFYDYHWLPFRYFALLLASLCLVRWAAGAAPRHLAAALLVPLLFSPLVHDSLTTIKRSIEGSGAEPELELKLRRVDAISTYLEAHLQPGDEVQPLDWTGGAVHAMLRTKAELATKFIYDVPFYHDVSEPYIQRLRRRFVSDLARSEPRFVVEITGDKPWPAGPGTTREFVELRDLLRRRYAVAATGEGYVVYTRGTTRIAN